MQTRERSLSALTCDHSMLLPRTDRLPNLLHGGPGRGMCLPCAGCADCVEPSLLADLPWRPAQQPWPASQEMLFTQYSAEMCFADCNIPLEWHAAVEPEPGTSSSLQ